MGLFDKIARSLAGKPVTNRSATKRVINHSRLGLVTFYRRAGSKNIRLSVTASRGFLLSYPWHVSFEQALQFLKNQEEWALAALDRVQKRTKNEVSLTSQELEALRKAAKLQLPQQLAQLAQKHSFAYNQVFIKNNKTNWGSCSTKNNINLNLRLVTLPQDLCDYVLLHELCHTRVKNHGPQFWALLNSLTNNRAKELAKSLRNYKVS